MVLVAGTSKTSAFLRRYNREAPQRKFGEPFFYLFPVAFPPQECSPEGQGERRVAFKQLVDVGENPKTPCFRGDVGEFTELASCLLCSTVSREGAGRLFSFKE